MRGRNVLAMEKGAERYVFMWDDHEDSRGVLLQHLGRCAADKELDFSWYDAAVLAQRVRAQCKERA